MSYPRPKRRSTTVFSRDEIGVEQLASLKEKFADGDLNEKEFVGLFREIVDSSLSETQLIELFQKIDANSDGTVDWDELTNYMFLSGSDNSADFIGDDNNLCYDVSQPEKHCDAGETSDGAGTRPLHHHKDAITRVLRMEKPYLYITASKDGSVRTWNANTMAFQSVLTTGKNWITDCSIMRRSNRLAVASMNRTLGFYDLNSGLLIGEVNEYSKKQCIPLCLEYVEKPSDDREALVIGDDTGGITVMTCSNQWLACDGRSSTGAAVSNSGNNVVSVNATGTGTSLETQGFSSRTKFKKHNDWVTRVKWVNDIRAVVATSLDTNISIIDVDRMVVKFEYNRHKKGVFDLVWCSSTRLIASCGMERDISIWNPYSSQRAVATLRGHTSSVLHLASDDDNYQIISTSSDNTVKVWDVRNHRCLQTFVDHYKSTGGAESRISALLYDPKYPCLISATTHLTRWPVKAHAEDEQVDDMQEKAACIARYNGVFHQVVTAEISSESVVRTWSAETGEEICSFANAHGQSPITAICFDSAGRRLLTGGHDGLLIKMWNFSNGALVKQFLKQEEDQATNVAPTSTSLLGSTTSASGSSSISSPGSGDPSANGGGGGGGGAGANDSPRKRKIRDIVLLPSTFGAHCDDKQGSNRELPSPTRTRLTQVTDPDVDLYEKSLEEVQRRVHHEITEPVVKPKAKPRASISGTSTGTGTGISTSDETKTNANASSTKRGGGAGPESTNYQKEVTSILDIERNLRVGMGDFICQRFVCSVGWDCNIYIWADKNDESEALPVHLMPNDKTYDPSKCHNMDILALVFLPPAYIATAGLDGKILLWSLNSGEFVSKIYQCATSIEAMTYAQKVEMIFASGESGQLVCIDRSMTMQGEIPLDHPNDEAVIAIRCDRSNSHLVTGDSAGIIKLWDINISSDHEGIVLEYCCHWRVGNGSRIVSLDFIENPRLNELFLLISCGNGEVSIWTLDGMEVGNFGKRRGWLLGRPNTYESAVSRIFPVSDEEANEQRHMVRCFTIASLKAVIGYECKESFLLEDSMPKPGEVWIHVSGHRRVPIGGAAGAAAAVAAAAAAATTTTGTIDPSKSSSTKSNEVRQAREVSATKGQDNGNMKAGDEDVDESATDAEHENDSEDENEGDEDQAESEPQCLLARAEALNQILSDTTGEVTDLITVIKVTKGELLCWDGIAENQPVQKSVEMSDFVRKAGWMKHKMLTQYIGRMFLMEEMPFRVNSLCMNASKADRMVFSLVDVEGQQHDMIPLNESVSMGKAKLRITKRNEQLTHQSSGLDLFAERQLLNRKMLTKGRSSIMASRSLTPTTTGSVLDKYDLDANMTPVQLNNLRLSTDQGQTIRYTVPTPPPAANTSSSSSTSSATNSMASAANANANPNTSANGNPPTSSSTGGTSTTGLSSNTMTAASTSSLSSASQSNTTNNTTNNNTNNNNNSSNNNNNNNTVASMPVTATSLILPLLSKKDKRVMGGTLPKRSALRNRHDQSMDFRRIHVPDEIPKSFRAMIAQRIPNPSTRSPSYTSANGGATSASNSVGGANGTITTGGSGGSGASGAGGSGGSGASGGGAGAAAGSNSPTNITSLANNTNSATSNGSGTSGNNSNE